jgi:hypothetical protein
MGGNSVKLTVNNYGGTVNIIPRDPNCENPIQITNNPTLQDTRTDMISIREKDSCAKLPPIPADEPSCKITNIPLEWIADKTDVPPAPINTTMQTHSKITKLEDFEANVTYLSTEVFVGRGGCSLSIDGLIMLRANTRSAVAAIYTTAKNNHTDVCLSYSPSSDQWYVSGSSINNHFSPPCKCGALYCEELKKMAA